MGIEHLNPYNQRPIGLSKKATAGSKLLEAKELAPDKSSMRNIKSRPREHSPGRLSLCPFMYQFQ